MRFSTSTLTASGEVVPWLAAAGDLAYSPASPPDRDYYFQYSWIVPGIFRPDANKPHHYWFGGSIKDCPNVRRLFRFWSLARVGEHAARYVANGTVDPSGDVTSPIAAYRFADASPSSSHDERLILMQHGSYHIGDVQSQPFIERGDALLRRGVQDAETYQLHRLTTSALRTKLMRVHARTLTDSVVSFNAAHCNLVRCETEGFNDRSFMFDGLCLEAGLDPDFPAIRSAIYSGFALETWCASRKFGPNYVTFRTPLTNLRITTFVCGETEVKVIDPNKLTVMETVGCKVREVFT